MKTDPIKVEDDGTMRVDEPGTVFLLVPAIDQQNVGHYPAVVLLDGDKNRAYDAPGPDWITPGEAFNFLVFTGLVPGDWWRVYVLPTAFAGWSGPAQPDRRAVELLADVRYSRFTPFAPGTYYLWPASQAGGEADLREVNANGRPAPFDFGGAEAARLAVFGGLVNGAATPHAPVPVTVTVEGATDGSADASPCAPVAINGQQSLALGDGDVVETFCLVKAGAVATHVPPLTFPDGAATRNDRAGLAYWPSTLVTGPLPRWARIRVDVGAPGSALPVPPIPLHLDGLGLRLERERLTVGSAW